MPRYFFDAMDGRLEIDRSGTEYQTESEAQVAAIKFAADYVSAQPEVVASSEHFRVNVKDESRKLVYSIVVYSVDPRVFGGSNRD